ncbi:MAG: hypothetical protein LBI91_00525 [Spirochaetaceae bacterium]|jgi:hypothetical protein|nr:hypothetical protein [Spirochaetaceae bacterium]
MAQRTDLYTILLSYASKRHAPSIDIDNFILFIEKYANHYVRERPEWQKWTSDAAAKFWAELTPLVESGKCKLIGSGPGGKVLMLDFYFEAVNKAYENPDALAELPFPDEKTLGISIPAEQLRELNVATDLDEYMEYPQESDMPLLKIVFSESLGSALVLASYIPRRILEISVLKTSAFLKIEHNAEYFFVRLTSQFAGKEPLLRNILAQIELKPKECFAHIETAGEFACLFWPLFCSLIRMELKKKSEFTALDISVLQSTFIIEFFVSYYRSIMGRKRDLELAMKEIELRIERPPYAYSLKDIMKFSDATGRPLTDFYSQKDLDGFLNEKTQAEGNSDPGKRLPPLLIFHNRFNEQVFISKAKVFPLITKLIGEARPQVQKAIRNRWGKLIKEFESEPSMENEKDFEKLAALYAHQVAPSLMMLLEDKKLFLVQEEASASQGGVLNYKIYQATGALVPLSELLTLNRKDILTDVRIMLPFWYSIPVISSIVAFFKRLGQDKNKKRKAAPQEQENQDREIPSAHSTSLAQEMKRAAVDYQIQALPMGKTLDQQLRDMEDHWRKVIDSEAKKQLVRDVHSQIKRKLKPILDARGNRKITSQTIDEMADSVIMVSPALTELNNSDKIHNYVALYIVNLLKQQQ